MNNFNRSKYNNLLKYLLPSLVTALIFCTVLLIKGIYPFGAATIDFYDLSDQGTPIYLHIYDSIHGHKNLFYDIYSALTTNMTGMLGTSGISPFNLFFLFIKRESVLKCMSIFILLKMMVMSFGMYLFLDKATKVQYVYKLTFAVCYGFSGYILLHYTSHIWFDNVAYFPFVVTGLYLLIKEGKCILYTVAMSLSLICGYYISFLFFIYIFLIVGLALIISKIDARTNPDFDTNPNSNPNSRNNLQVSASNNHHYAKGSYDSGIKNFHLIELLICTIVSMLASAFILIPQIYQTFSSARFTNESGGGILGMYMGILKNVMPAYTSRWFVILNISFSVAIIIVGFIKYRNNKKLAFFTIGSIIIICAELLFENVNLFWHYGSYVHYPLRNGFIIGFTLSYLACLYLEKFPINLDNSARSHFISIVFSIVCFAFSIFAMYIYHRHPGMSQRSVFHMLAAVMVVCNVIYILLVIIKNGSYLKFASILVAGELLFYGFIFLGEPTYITGYTEEPEMERDSYYICNQLYEAFHLGQYDTDVAFNGSLHSAYNDYMNIMNRVKNPDESLNSNYALVLRRSALSNWTALISPKLQKSAKRLGYTVQYTRLLDSGGTVFSDALIGIKNVITNVPQDEKLYDLTDTADVVINQKTGEKDKYYYYKCKYELPWGMQLSNIDSIDFDENDIVNLYNCIYSAILKQDNKTASAAGDSSTLSGIQAPSSPEYNPPNIIAEYIDLPASQNVENGEQLTQNITINGNKALYYFANQVDTDDYNTTIKVNGNVIQIPSISEKYNVLYPAHFNNNVIYLGSFDNEDINIEINFSKTDKNGNIIESQFEPALMTIDLNLLGSLCESYKGYSSVTNIDKTSYELNVETDSDGYVMLPLSYDNGYKARVNGKEEKVEFLGGLFMAVPIYEGQNDIHIKFSPSGLLTGTVISIITVISAIIIYCIFKNKKIRRSVVLEKLYIFAWCAVVILMYIIPMLYALASKVLSVFNA